LGDTFFLRSKTPITGSCTKKKLKLFILLLQLKGSGFKVRSSDRTHFVIAKGQIADLAKDRNRNIHLADELKGKIKKTIISSFSIRDETT